MNILAEPVTIVYLMNIANKNVFIDDNVKDVRFKDIHDMSATPGFICDAKDAAKEVTNKKTVQ